MFNKYKYLLPLMLGVTLVNSGYSMNESTSDVGVKSLSQKEINTFFEAIKKGNLEEVGRLLESNPDYINATNEYGYPPLHWASEKGHLPIVEYLISKGADKDAKDIDDYTPLHYASWKGHLSIVESLITKGADVNDKNKWNETPLHIASEYGQLEIVKLLIEKGAKIDDKGYNDKTLLHIASSSGHLPIVESLITKGADINAKDEYGYTPLDLAENEEIADLLKAKGAKKGSELN